MLNVVWSVILAILILLAMITVHEFGHFLAGKILGFKIDEFAIGFGPKLFSRRGKKGVLFSIRLLPLGGYCAFDGEDTDGESEDSFNKKAPWRRIIVLLAGAAMNYLTALLLIIVLFTACGQPCYRINAVAESDVYPSQYSLQDGDIILKAEGRGIYLSTDFVYALNGHSAGDMVELTVIRGGEKTDIQVMLRADCLFENSSQISGVFRALGADTYMGEDGNNYWNVGAVSYRRGFFQSVGCSFAYSFRIAGTLFRVLGELLTGSLGLEAVGGPVTTIKLTSQIASQSFASFLEIAAYIGVNLAVFNILPIPALDGSKVVFCLIEWIFKKPVPRKVEAVIHAVGFVLILAFAVIVDVLAFL